MTIDMSEFCVSVLAIAASCVTVFFMLCVTYWLGVDNDI